MPYDLARIAKTKLHEKVKDIEGFCGIGITVNSGGELYLRVSIKSDVEFNKSSIPGEIDGFEVEVLRMGAIKPRSK